MKLNCDCVRDVLLQLEELLVCEQNDDGFSFKPVKLKDLNEKFSDKYSNDEILYTICKLKDGKYIKAKTIDANSKVVYCEVSEITNEGHMFLDTIRPKSLWEQLIKDLPSVSSIATITNTILQISSRFIG